jgi:hypothetical protein
MRSALFWDITQRIVIIYYRLFWKTYRFHLKRVKQWDPSFLLTFRDNLSVPSQRVKKSDPSFLLTFRDNLPVQSQRVKKSDPIFLLTFRDNLPVPSQRVKKSDPSFLLTFRDNLSVPPSRIISKEALTYCIQKCVVHLSFVLLSPIHKTVTFYLEKHIFPTSVFHFADIEAFLMIGMYRDNSCTKWRKLHVCGYLGNTKKKKKSNI